MDPMAKDGFSQENRQEVADNGDLVFTSQKGNIL
jgi:hypothetical protein